MSFRRKANALLIVFILGYTAVVHGQDLTTLFSKFLVDLRAGTIGSSQPVGIVTVTNSGIGATATDGLVLTNTTASTAGVTEQISPRIRLCGAAWNSVSLASETNCWVIENVPITAAGATVSGLTFSRSLAGGAYSTIFTVFTNGTHRLTASAGTLTWNGRTRYASPANGLTNVTDNGQTIGVQFNNTTVQPTFNNGTITTGSRNMGGQVTLTGGNTGGTLSFGGTAWTNAPFCTVTGSAATDTINITGVTTGTLVVAGVTANGVFTYNCIGRV